MHIAQTAATTTPTGTATTTTATPTAATATATGADAGTGSGTATGTAGDPRLTWSSTEPTRVPAISHRRDGILPTVAAALSVRGTDTLTCTAGRGDQPPPLHPLVQDFLDTLSSGQRERFTGRCPEAILLSRHITATEGSRSKRASRKPLTTGEARRSLKHSKLTARRIREDGDPLHGSYAPPCRSCTPMLAHFGVRAVDLTATTTEKG
ncbi:YwqJ-related putative deaminase [Streptomyces flavidovirens]|uniref:YwqJ-related putative deaminase n=1 Tax=Streptomyces flavidovirens TaxID=67298 RepID=UPI0004136963|nr:YwqJ-related putative deaminase [Streptomyces flavidovirens]